jgi:hypothetical protein
MSESINACRTFVGKLELKRPLEGPMHEDSIKIYLIEIGGCGVASSGSRLESVTGCCEHGNEFLVSIKFWEFLK